MNATERETMETDQPGRLRRLSLEDEPQSVGASLGIIDAAARSESSG